MPSAARASSLLPKLRAPFGDVPRSELQFDWDWQGPPRKWDLVVLDEDLEEVFSAPLDPGRAPVPTALRDLLETGESYYWLVRSRGATDPVRSSPVLFRVGS